MQAWVKHRWRLKVQEPVSEPEGVPLDIQGHLAMDDVDLVMLVGLPGMMPPQQMLLLLA